LSSCRESLPLQQCVPPRMPRPVRVRVSSCRKAAILLRLLLLLTPILTAAVLTHSSPRQDEHWKLLHSSRKSRSSNKMSSGWLESGRMSGSGSGSGRVRSSRREDARSCGRDWVSNKPPMTQPGCPPRRGSSRSLQTGMHSQVGPTRLQHHPNPPHFGLPGFPHTRTGTRHPALPLVLLVLLVPLLG